MSTSNRAHRRSQILLVPAALIILAALALLPVQNRTGMIAPRASMGVAVTVTPTPTPPLGFGLVLGARAVGVVPTVGLRGIPTPTGSRRPVPPCSQGRP